MLLFLEEYDGIALPVLEGNVTIGESRQCCLLEHLIIRLLKIIAATRSIGIKNDFSQLCKDACAGLTSG